MAKPTLYKAQVMLRWRNRISGERIEAPPGMLLSFDEGDFNDPDIGPDGSMESLEHMLDSGALVEFDEATAGDPEYMSRDEMLWTLDAWGVTGADGDKLAHNATADTLRPLVVAEQEKRRQAADKAAGAKKRKRSGGR